MDDAEKKQRFKQITQEMEDNERKITRVISEMKTLEQEKNLLNNVNHGLHQTRGLYCTEHNYGGLRTISMYKSSPCNFCGNTDYEGPYANHSTGLIVSTSALGNGVLGGATINKVT